MRCHAEFAAAAAAEEEEACCEGVALCEKDGCRAGSDMVLQKGLNVLERVVVLPRRIVR